MISSIYCLNHNIPFGFFSINLKESSHISFRESFVFHPKIKNAFSGFAVKIGTSPGLLGAN
jgi:hypothetical protein